MTYVDLVSGDVPTHQIAIDSKWHETTLLLFQFIATTQKAAS